MSCFESSIHRYSHVESQHPEVRTHSQFSEVSISLSHNFFFDCILLQASKYCSQFQYISIVSEFFDYSVIYYCSHCYLLETIKHIPQFISLYFLVKYLDFLFIISVSSSIRSQIEQSTFNFVFIQSLLNHETFAFTQTINFSAKQFESKYYFIMINNFIQAFNLTSFFLLQHLYFVIAYQLFEHSSA